MKKIKTYFIRALLLNKRLLKKTSFLIILGMIPLLTLAMVVFSNDESGILTVTLCAEDKNDSLADSIINELLTEDGILRFVKAENVKEAYDNVEFGKSDSAWIFSKELQTKIDNFVSGKKVPFVTVIERENDVSLQLSHEKLCGAVYPHVSRAIFRNYVLNNVFSPGEITTDEINKSYDDSIGGGSLISFKKIDGSVTKTTNYLSAPLRGILSLVVLLCGLAAVMYHQTDRENRIYDWLSPSKHILPGIATTGASVLDSTVIIMIALAISGLFLSPIWEILGAITYILAVTAFCTFIGCLTQKTARTGQIIPFLMLICLVVSPIFFNFSALKPLQLCLPTYYYLYAVYQPMYIAYSLIYSAIVFGSSFLINAVTEK